MKLFKFFIEAIKKEFEVINQYSQRWRTLAKLLFILYLLGNIFLVTSWLRAITTRSSDDSFFLLTFTLLFGYLIWRVDYAVLSRPHRIFMGAVDVQRKKKFLEFPITFSNLLMSLGIISVILFFYWIIFCCYFFVNYYFLSEIIVIFSKYWGLSW